MEASLAAAHRALVKAKGFADEMNDEGAYLDIQQIEIELVRVAEGSLRATGRRVLRDRLSGDSAQRSVS
jgi:hypothetical protein